MNSSAHASRKEATVSITVDGVAHSAVAGTSVAVALENAGIPLRRSVRGEARGAVCGMGICHECRVTINGVPQLRACMVAVVEDMDVHTHG